MYIYIIYIIYIDRLICIYVYTYHFTSLGQRYPCSPLENDLLISPNPPQNYEEFSHWVHGYLSKLLPISKFEAVIHILFGCKLSYSCYHMYDRLSYNSINKSHAAYTNTLRPGFPPPQFFPAIPFRLEFACLGHQILVVMGGLGVFDLISTNPINVQIPTTFSVAPPKLT